MRYVLRCDLLVRHWRGDLCLLSDSTGVVRGRTVGDPQRGNFQQRSSQSPCYRADARRRGDEGSQGLLEVTASPRISSAPCDLGVAFAWQVVPRLIQIVALFIIQR